MIIAFGSKARQGKDTCCSAIKAHYKKQESDCRAHDSRFHKVPHVTQVNFADALRREVTEAIASAGGVQALFNQGARLGEHFPSWVTPDPNPDMTDPLLPHGKHSKLLQWWGTEYRRAQNPNYWVERYVEEVTKHRDLILTSDVRFRNEAVAIKCIKGVTVNVTRVNPDGSMYFDSSRQRDHASEIDLDGYGWDFYLKAVTGQAAFLEQQAVLLAEYLTDWRSNGNY